MFVTIARTQIERLFFLGMFAHETGHHLRNTATSNVLPHFRDFQAVSRGTHAENRKLIATQKRNH